MDPPLADVVSLAEKARVRGGATSEAPASTTQVPDANGDEPVLGGAGHLESQDLFVEPADLARQAMFRRLGHLTDRGAAAGGTRSVDDEMAVLVYDSATARRPVAGVRGGSQLGGNRQLTFQTSDLMIEVELDGSGREMTCQVVPPQPAALEVRHPGGTVELGADDFGTFHVQELPASTISLRCLPLAADAGPVATSWITV